MKFKNLMFEGNISEEEGYNKLKEKIIHGMAMWIAEKECKELKKNPTIEVIFLVELDSRRARGTLKNICGENPKNPRLPWEREVEGCFRQQRSG